ncbi:MAG: ATP-grasp domain-containing protein [Methanosarcinales archaeon]|nr:ATP-grasp domain-containing protein [Methanosarcinales archaeon]
MIEGTDFMTGIFDDIVDILSNKYAEYGVKSSIKKIKEKYHYLKKPPFDDDKDLIDTDDYSDKSPQPLIAFIGGGEIAVEIAHAATQLGWDFVCFDEIQGYTNEEEKEWQIPMSKFGTFEGVSKFDNTVNILGDLSSSCYQVKDDPIVDLEHYFSNNNPDVILLEKNFIPLENWETLQTILKMNFKGKKNRLIPNMDLANFFIDKIEMKNILQKKMGNKIIAKYKELDISDIENSRDKIEKEIEQFLSEHESIILKPAISESGLGQSEINSTSDIKPAIVKLIRAPLIKNQKKAIMEKKIDFITEAYIAVIRPITNPNSPPMCIGPISYKKKPFQQFGGPVRLIESEYPIDLRIRNQKVEDEIKKIKNEICKHIKTPFLGIEFFICSDNRVLINEVVWRPDDAGFITLVSHTKDQFQLFMESLMFHQIIEPSGGKDGNFKCVALLKDQPLSYPFLSSKMNGDDYSFHFYHQSFRNNLEKKIVGYLIANIGDGCSYQSMDEFKNDIIKVLVEYYDDEEAKNFYFSDDIAN